MTDEDGYFGEPVAATFDDDNAWQANPAIVEPMVDVLAELAGDGRALTTSGRSIASSNAVRSHSATSGRPSST